MVLEFVAVDNFDFTRKIVKKFGVKNSGFVKVEFLDKNLTFSIVCLTYLQIESSHDTIWAVDKDNTVWFKEFSFVDEYLKRKEVA